MDYASGHIVEVNPAAIELFGYTEAEFFSMKGKDLHPPEALSEVDEVSSEIRCTARGDRARFLCVRKDGERFYGSFALRVFESAGTRWMISIIRDIDAEVMREHELEAARVELGALLQQLAGEEERFRTLIQASPDVVLVNGSGIVLFANLAAIAGLGRDPTGERLDELCTAPQNGGRIQLGDQSATYEALVLDIEWDGEPAQLIQGRDVSGRDELASRMAELDRIITMGALAAGIGHSINNPLSYVHANVEVSIELLGEAKRTRDWALVTEVIEALTDARQGTHRLRDTVKDLRRLSRAGSSPEAPVVLDDLVHSSVLLVRNLVDLKAQLELDLHSVGTVLCDESRVGNAVVNLVANAADAIESGHSDINRVRVELRAVDREAVLVVEDTGRGIPDDVARHIFDPFFTTKPVGRGSGLGLTLSRRAIVEARGSIAMSSSECGTRFEVRLPLYSR